MSDRIAELFDDIVLLTRSLDEDDPNLQKTFDHPVFGQLNILEWIAFQRLHGMDHMQQIDKNRAGLELPRRMTFLARVYVTLKPTVNDPPGLTIKGALHSLGFAAVDSVRAGKYMEIRVDAASKEAGRVRRHRDVQEAPRQPRDRGLPLRGSRSLNRALGAGDVAGGSGSIATAARRHGPAP